MERHNVISPPNLLEINYAATDLKDIGLDVMIKTARSKPRGKWIFPEHESGVEHWSSVAAELCGAVGEEGNLDSTGVPASMSHSLHRISQTRKCAR